MKDLFINYKKEFEGKAVQITVETGKVSTHFYEVNEQENSRINIVKTASETTKNVNTTGDFTKFAALVNSVTDYVEKNFEALTLTIQAISEDENIN